MNWFYRVLLQNRIFKDFWIHCEFWKELYFFLLVRATPFRSSQRQDPSAPREGHRSATAAATTASARFWGAARRLWSREKKKKLVQRSPKILPHEIKTQKNFQKTRKNSNLQDSKVDNKSQLEEGSREEAERNKKKNYAKGQQPQKNFNFQKTYTTRWRLMVGRKEKKLD